jgi:hypothetical protein
MIRRALYHGFSFIAEGKIRKLVSDSRHPRATQLKKLQSILRSNELTAFGKDHGFAAIRSEKDFQQAVPVRDYEQLSGYVDRAVAGEREVLTADEIIMFATTSGTSGKPKFIPVTAGYLEEFRLASIVSGYNLLRAFPGISGGATLSLVSPAEEGRTSGGLPYGAISGQLFQHEPYLIKKYISPIPYDVFLIKDYEAKYYTLLRLALVMPLSCFYTLNPSTIALLCRRLAQHADRLVDDVRTGRLNAPVKLPDTTLARLSPFLRPDSRRAAELQALIDAGEFVPHRIWPQLAVVSCWTKAAASFYLSDFPKYFADVPVCDITYGASEGRGTVLMGPGKQMLALHSHYFEFVPEEEIERSNPSVLLADEVEVGRSYYILFTTSGGLYRYNINDVVKVTGFYNNTPMLEFQYKGGNICSFTGEKLTELQVVQAVHSALARSGSRLRFFTVVPRFRPQPHYQLLLEFAPPLAPGNEVQERVAATIAQAFDEELGCLNVEYLAKRESKRLDPVTYELLPVGAYEAFRKHLVSQGVADAQIKVSHLNPKDEIREFFDRSCAIKLA